MHEAPEERSMSRSAWAELAGVISKLSYEALGNVADQPIEVFWAGFQATACSANQEHVIPLTSFEASVQPGTTVVDDADDDEAETAELLRETDDDVVFLEVAKKNLGTDNIMSMIKTTAMIVAIFFLFIAI